MATGEGALGTRASVAAPRLVRRRPQVLAAAGLALLALCFVAAVGLGSVAVSPLEILGIIGNQLFGLSSAGTWPASAETIIWELRVPRVLTAMVVGVGLAVAGATFQGLLRNPLADPYVLGTASGAALGAAIAVLIPVRIAILQFGLLHAFAFIGALAAVWVVYRVARSSGLAPLTSLVLTGYAIGSLLAAALALAMYVSGTALRQIFVFLMGSFDASSWDRFAGAAPLILIGTLLVLYRARSINGLLLGEETAQHLGVDVRRERAILLAMAALLTAAAVAVSGLIGFVGLVVPHVVRLVVGPNARVVLPLSALFGAILLVTADLVARLIGEIPVGVVTAVIGAPFFISILRRARAGYEL